MIPSICEILSPSPWRILAMLVCGVALSHVALAQRPPVSLPPIIDTHAYFAGNPRGGAFRDAMEMAMKRMDRHGISKSVIVPQPFAKGMHAAHDIDLYVAAHVPHARPLALGGGGLWLNQLVFETPADEVDGAVRRRFGQLADRIAGMGAVSFGEIAIHQLSLRNRGPGHPYLSVEPDHPLLLQLADIAARKQMVIDVHIDLVPIEMRLPPRLVFSSANPARLQANREGFERLLAHNRFARFVWVASGAEFLGVRTVALQREMLLRHPNLYMGLKLGQGGESLGFALDSYRRLKPEWVAFLTRFHDRFVIGSNFYHAPESVRSPGAETNSLENYQTALSQLPTHVAEAIAWRNAERIYRLDRVAERADR